MRVRVCVGNNQVIRKKGGRVVQQRCLGALVCEPSSLTVGRNCFDKLGEGGRKGGLGGMEGKEMGYHRGMSTFYCIANLSFWEGGIEAPLLASSSSSSFDTMMCPSHDERDIF